MSLYRVLLKDLAPVYAGVNARTRKSGALVHSDAIHAALVSTAALTDSAFIEVLLDARLSSLFPFWNNVFFYPKPFLAPPESPGSGATTTADRKRWKSIRLVSPGLLDAWIRGDGATVRSAELIGSSAAMLESETEGRVPPQRLVYEDLLPGVAVDRISQSTTPYTRRLIRLNRDAECGAYFLIDLPGAEAGRLKELVEMLGEQGLGGERSLGYGGFTVERVEPFAFPGMTQGRRAGAAISLGLYLPTQTEVEAGVLNGPAAYDCTMRGGWLSDIAGTSFKKMSVRMCVEGSVFPLAGAINGACVDLRPDIFQAHPVWRSGRGIMMPFACAATAGAGYEV